ncbi:MAG TPA: hypothetical protein VEQ63_16280, partial [Bryobacteraceae bacterium]|nr:hypothetical protein [Bryobacteraceae bacterium]
VFQRLLPRLGYKKAIWAIAHRLCRLIWKVLHQEIRYVELGVTPNPLALKRRSQKLVAELQRLGYRVNLTPLPLQPAD